MRDRLRSFLQVLLGGLAGAVAWWTGLLLVLGPAQALLADRSLPPRPCRSAASQGATFGAFRRTIDVSVIIGATGQVRPRMIRRGRVTMAEPAHYRSHKS